MRSSNSAIRFLLEKNVQALFYRQEWGTPNAQSRMHRITMQNSRKENK
jgi:hypothetical protein